MKTLICNCNQTMALDAPALRQALAKTPGSHTDGLDTVHTLLCRREAPAFQRAATATSNSGDELLVACTQESRLFLELNEQTAGAASIAERPIRFVNIRESAGWSRDKDSATPKMAALLAMAQLPPPDPVPTASYRSAGRCLVVGPADAAERAAALLQDRLDVSVLVTAPGSAMAQVHARATHTGELTSLVGWLGQFKAEWSNRNPIDLDLCTRCNACVDACPEGAIGLDYQINLDACRNHRDCVRVCDAAGAIDFQREPLVQQDSFDLVLDLRAAPAFGQHQPPQGYFHVPPESLPPNQAVSSALMDAVLQLRELVGEFEKPRFFRYQHSLCAHSRNELQGCTACIDVCSTSAIRSDASRKGKGKTELFGGVIVEPHLCVGCGACATVCPSGAMGYAYPGTVDQGKRMRTMLTAYAHAGGRDAALLIHSEGAGRALIEALGRGARVAHGVQAKQAKQAGQSSPARHGPLLGLPQRVLPVAAWHTASVGIDLWLAAIAQGASQVWVLLTDEEAPQYRQVLQEQMAVAQAILSGLGFAGTHLRLIDVDGRGTDALPWLDGALRAAAAQTVVRPAAFAAQADKRATLDLALDHLLAQAPAFDDAAGAAISLPAAGAPYGTLLVDTSKCTLCLSCVSACPEAALADNPDKPQLRFIEKNCVQCGLCATTCPEDAITLQPRLWLADGGKARRNARVLAEMEPYRCIKCAKPFGTLLAIEKMLSKLSGHAAFQGAAAARLKMCGDCRVVDLYSNPAEVRIQDL
ncbi:MAG: 4Fe-4S binding protein [Rubrivivax sp.]|nr:4Fe-4S binding protein [Rubrivivax sp.]